MVDTEMVGPFGCSADSSGTWPTADVEPGSDQGDPGSKLEDRYLVTDEGPFEEVLPA